METPYKPPSILRLTGISLKDYVPIEDVADSRLLDPGSDGSAFGAPDFDEPAPESVQPFDKIPRLFTGLEDWPYRTNLRCHKCHFTFDDRPKFVPTYVREGESGGIEAGVLGNFCTFNHAELFIEDFYHKPEERWRAQDNLCLVYFIFTGRRVSRIKPGLPVTELRQYGGDLDEDTFWRKLRELDPVAGLRDHTPGSVVPERERTRAALAFMAGRASIGAAPTPRALAEAPNSLGARKASPGEPLAVSSRSVWGLCGLPSIAAAALSLSTFSAAAGPPSPSDPALTPTAGNVAAGPETVAWTEKNAALSRTRAPADSIAVDLPTASRGDNLQSSAGEDDLETLLAERDRDRDRDRDSEAEGSPGFAAEGDGGLDLDELLGTDAASDADGGSEPDSGPLPSAPHSEPTPTPTPTPTLQPPGMSDADVDDLLADLGVF
jgi:hypothetical protein